MKTDITIQSIYAGLFLFVACFIGIMLELFSLVVILTHFLPGLILGFIITQSITHPVSDKKKILFILCSTGIHIACVFLADVFKNDEIWIPIKLIIASTTGALLLALAYDLLIMKKVSLSQTVLVPMVIGIVSSLLSAICLYYMHQFGFDQELLEKFQWAGIFSIFPFWFYLFALKIKISNKSAPRSNFNFN
ncbi:MAG TPA: hypothetical protein VGD17_01170 [Chitinophagaceae bacterium]